MIFFQDSCSYGSYTFVSVFVSTYDLFLDGLLICYRLFSVRFFPTTSFFLHLSSLSPPIIILQSYFRQSRSHRCGIRWVTASPSFCLSHLLLRPSPRILLPHTLLAFSPKYIIHAYILSFDYDFCMSPNINSLKPFLPYPRSYRLHLI